MNDPLFTDSHYRELSSWPIERVRAFADRPDCQAQQLEAVREAAQAHAYRPELSRQDRLEWAKLSLHVNDRMRVDDPWQQARRACNNFMLRTWIIDNLGPQPGDADWDPNLVAADTLAELTLDPKQALDRCRNWRDLPRDRIGELRRHKNMTGHLPTLINHIQPGPTQDELRRWIQVREQLP